MPKIFISYRRDDAGGHARHLYDELAERYGEKNVFMDVATLEGGERWAERIDESIAECDVFLALIGKRWVDARDAEGNRRLDAPVDYVRKEVASGLGRDVLAIPVLLDGTKMPGAAELPDEIDDLTQRNAAQLSSASWDHELELLLERLPPPTSRWWLRGAVAATIITLLALGYFLVPGWLEKPPERMSGIFNVAVVDFGERSGQGSVVQESEAGQWIAERVFEGLSEVEATLSADGDMQGVVEIRRFDVGVRGASDAEIESSLSELAESYNATLVMYGVLDLDEPPYRFAPSMYLTQDFNGGAELTGEATLGRPVRLSLPLDETAVGRQNRLKLAEEMRGRLEALHLVTLGLAYMQIDEPSRALGLFEAANEVEGWSEGREVVHLFRGSALMLLDRLRDARDAFVAALEAGGEEYDRGLMAMGNLFFANGSLDRAADLYRRALAASPSAPLAQVEPKSRFNLGLTLAFQARGLETPCEAEEAERELAQVVAEYDDQPTSDVLRELAYKAEYQRGLLAQACGEGLDESSESRAAYAVSVERLGAATRLAEPRELAGDAGLREERPWQHDRWLAWRLLGTSQLRLAELGDDSLRPPAVESLRRVTERYERALGDVPDRVATDAYRELARALEPSDAPEADRLRDLADEISVLASDTG